jgi:zinc protease
VEPATVEHEIDAVLGDLLATGPTADELQRARSRRLADFVRGIERLGGFGGRSDVLAESLTYDGRADAYLDQLEALATATPAEVRATARDWLQTFHYTMTVRPYPKLAPGQSTVNRTVLPPLGEAPTVQVPEVQRTTLANGLKVMLLERHGTPIVNVALAVDAGYAADPVGKAGAFNNSMGLMYDPARKLVWAVGQHSHVHVLKLDHGTARAVPLT